MDYRCPRGSQDGRGRTLQKWQASPALINSTLFLLGIIIRRVMLLQTSAQQSQCADELIIINGEMIWEMMYGKPCRRARWQRYGTPAISNCVDVVNPIQQPSNIWPASGPILHQHWVDVSGFPRSRLALRRRRSIIAAILRVWVATYRVRIRETWPSGVINIVLWYTLSEHDTLPECWFDVGSASQTLIQH